ncbi:MAG: hypothetical protein J6C50_02875 [Rickettsiales bacterium]|nr:hypothetical protein [Rickettsiales bacterium]
MKSFGIIVYFLYFYTVFVVGVFAKNTIPEWYNNKPEDNKLYIFGIGSGDSVNEAVRSGIDNVYINIYTSVYNYVSDDAVGENIKKLKENAKEDLNINFSSYIIENSVNIDNKYYVLISFKRNELFNRQVSDLDVLNTAILTKYASIANYSDFVKLHKYKDILTLINNAQNKINIIKVIGIFNDIKYQDTYKKIKNDYKKIVDNIGVKLDLDKDLSFLLGNVVNGVLGDNGVKVKSKSQNKLIINSQNDIIKVHNIFVVKTKFMCKVVYKNNVISYKIFNYMYNSPDIKSISFDKNVNSFVDDIQNKKIQITEFGF